MRTAIRIVVGIFLLAASPSYTWLHAQQSPAPDFVPDYVFEADQFSTLTSNGAATWRADGGAITGDASEGSGMLMFDRGYQDVAVFAKFRCSDVCDAGILLRLENAMAGNEAILVSLAGETVKPYRAIFDKKGRLVKKELAYDLAQDFQPSPWSLPTKIESGVWNSIEIYINENEIVHHLNNQRHALQGGIAQVKPAFSKMDATTHLPDGFGKVALYVGNGKVTFEDIAIKDRNLTTIEPEITSERFELQQINSFAYAWGADAGDIDNDGELDIVSGPFYYLGPGFLTRGEYYPARTFSAGEEYMQNMLTYTYDWTGDGWEDILMTEMRPITLYVNPKGESRRWDRVAVLPDVCSEIAFRGDMDSDGVEEVAFVTTEGRLAYGEPDPGNPTGPWLVRNVSEKLGPGGCVAHGLGIGDVDGDGRPDMLHTNGWVAQPASDPAGGNWEYHEEVFGRPPNPYGGGTISVYDFNGDGLNDVVASLEAHGWGLAWFEQKRGADGQISFERHMIMDNYATKNAGDVTFSQPHAGAVLADIDRDGVMDFIAGKRHWAHLDTLVDPDAVGEAVIYWYRTVRNAEAPGGVAFEPELIHNKSGVGSEVKAIDINKDGAVDILAAGSRGTFVFWGMPVE